MADPLRRTLLAKLRGKKSKKGATVGGGYGSAAAANGGREGKEKVLQTQRDSDEAHPLVLLTELDCTTERMSTYENCVDGAMVQTGGVVVVREGLAAELPGALPQEPSSGGRVRVNEELLGVSLQRNAQFGAHEVDRSHQGPRSTGKTVLSGVPLGGPHVHRKHFVSVPRQCSVGDSIGFGDNSNYVLCREPHTGISKPPEAQVIAADRDGREPIDGGYSRHMAETELAVNEHNANWSYDNSHTLGTDLPVCAAIDYTHCMSRSTEENIVIRNIESYGPEYAGDMRGIAGSLQSPTFFPTELDICDINMASLCATETSLRYPLDSEDDDYYDNEILPFYATIRAKSDGEKAEVTELPRPGQVKGQLDDSNSAQETDRLRNQLKEAYYLLINAMNDINLDVQQINVGLTEQQATSSCSSHSRDSLCSRLSAKNMDSDSWSSGGDHSPQQVSDTDSLLLCISGNFESGLKARLNSKSMVNLSLTKIRPMLLRSVSDGGIRYACGQPSSGDKGATETKEAEGVRATGVSELSKPQVLHNAVSSDELQEAGGDEDRGRLNESSGSVNSLTCSSDSNAEASTNQGDNNKQEPTDARVQRANSVNKGHGVTVNKMQEWMHKGRLLSSEMKQRIEGSSLPCSGGQSQDRPCSLGNRGVKSVKVKSPRQHQPGRKATRSGLNSRGSSKSETSHPPSSRLIIVILLDS
ncbi:Rho GTPase-activating protein SYDE2 [Dissostichus eleginoides]|uniref:Rho GTPase-activating protein SYDE2 n=1 Tax=Dissostichus eleginoides TaxID=100907 RepID=A0AAD9C7S8_DISEL|nr:Rho GTPase-activating protein SYDE2 [Dissostichus eleginoides]